MYTIYDVRESFDIVTTDAQGSLYRFDEKTNVSFRNSKGIDIPIFGVIDNGNDITLTIFPKVEMQKSATIVDNLTVRDLKSTTINTGSITAGAITAGTIQGNDNVDFKKGLKLGDDLTIAAGKRIRLGANHLRDSGGRVAIGNSIAKNINYTKLLPREIAIDEADGFLRWFALRGIDNIDFQGAVGSNSHVRNPQYF